MSYTEAEDIAVSHTAVRWSGARRKQTQMRSLIQWTKTSTAERGLLEDLFSTLARQHVEDRHRDHRQPGAFHLNATVKNGDIGRIDMSSLVV